MNKSKSLAYLESLNVNQMRFGLKPIRQLLSRLDYPHQSYPTIIIGGTNGKGSTAAMLSSILHSAGYRVGLYTSPHLTDVRERIMINGEKISRRDFSRLIEQVRGEIQNPVTYFEFLTAVAFVYFQSQKIDMAVLEVGLGGRLDATNVCNPLVSVITNIDLDHMSYLGNTLEAITREKAGIIRPRGFCVTAVRQKKVLAVLEDVCRKRRAKLYCLKRDIQIKNRYDHFFDYDGLNLHLKNVKVPLRGEHQFANCALALATLEICAKRGFPVCEKAVHRGLQNTHWEGRLEILQKKPLFVLDGAHNPAGIEALCRALKKDFHDHRLIFIFGALADKDYRRMLRKIASLGSTIILTQINTARAISLDCLMETAQKIHCPAVPTKTVKEAITKALNLACEKDLICAAGSFYLIAEVKESFSKMNLYARKASNFLLKRKNNERFLA